MIITGEVLLTIILSHGCAALVGGTLVYASQGMHFERMYDLLKMATSSEWISYSSYEELEDKKCSLEETINALIAKNEALNEDKIDLNRRCEALQTKIHCLEAYQCKEANKRGDNVFKTLKYIEGDDLSGDN